MNERWGGSEEDDRLSLNGCGGQRKGQVESDIFHWYLGIELNLVVTAHSFIHAHIVKLHQHRTHLSLSLYARNSARQCWLSAVRGGDEHPSWHHGCLLTCL